MKRVAKKTTVEDRSTPEWMKEKRGHQTEWIRVTNSKNWVCRVELNWIEEEAEQIRQKTVQWSHYRTTIVQFDALFGAIPPHIHSLFNFFILFIWSYVCDINRISFFFCKRCRINLLATKLCVVISILAFLKDLGFSSVCAFDLDIWFIPITYN